MGEPRWSGDACELRRSTRAPPCERTFADGAHAAGVARRRARTSASSLTRSAGARTSRSRRTRGRDESRARRASSRSCSNGARASSRKSSVSDLDDASRRIASFARSRDPWIVAVHMISEGVDIPRLRVGVFASNVVSELYFRQFCGRFVRTSLDPRQARGSVRLSARRRSLARARESHHGRRTARFARARRARRRRERALGHAATRAKLRRGRVRLDCGDRPRRTHARLRSALQSGRLSRDLTRRRNAWHVRRCGALRAGRRRTARRDACGTARRSAT